MSTTKKQKKPVEVIVFEDPARRSKNKEPSSKPLPSLSAKNISKTHTSEMESFVYDQKKAKNDIRKLAMTGMNKSEKEIAMVDYLVELGAKKPKNKHVPLQEFMQDHKKRKLEGGIDKNYKKKKSNDDDDEKEKPKNKRKRDKDDILGFVDGQVGTYRRGVQFIKGGLKKKKNYGNKNKKR